MAKHTYKDGSTNLFAGTDDGLYTSTDNGSSWSQASKILPAGFPQFLDGCVGSGIHCLAFKGDTLIAGSWGEGIFTSTNKGQSWTKPTNVYYGGHVKSLEVSGNSIYAAIDGYGLLISKDNGYTWKQTNEGMYEPGILVLKFIGSYFFAGTPFRGIFRSSDGGGNWKQINNGLNNYKVQAITAIGSRIFVGTELGGISVSTDNGDSWSPVNNGLTDMNVNSFTVIGPVIFAGTKSGVFMSSNNGQSWAMVNSGLPQTDVRALASIGYDLFAGVWGSGIYRSGDNGKNWSAANSELINGIPLYSSCTLLANGANLFAATNLGMYLSANSGSTWYPINKGLTDTNIRTIKVIDSTLYAGTSHGAFKSTNNGAEWIPINNGLTSLNISSFAGSGSCIYAGTSDAGVFISPNNGSNWYQMNDGLTNLNIQALSVSGKNLIAGTHSGLFVLPDRRQEWTQKDRLGDTNIRKISVKDSCVYAMGSYYPIWISIDYGQNWNTAPYIACGEIISAAVCRSSFLVGTNFKDLFVSADNCSSWTNIRLSVYYHAIVTMTNNSSYLFAGINGEVWKKPLSEVTSTEKSTSVKYTGFSLEQNYPNPFNPVTTISYSLPKQANVELKIFDMLGREISTLVNKEQSPGEYKVQFDGLFLPSGIYVYTMKAGEFIESKKLLLLK